MISLDILLPHSPFNKDVWAVGRIRRPDVYQALKTKSLIPPGSYFAGCLYAYHVQRVAWLVKYGWKDPIHISLNNSFVVLDGSHRLAAAIFRKDTTILVRHV